MVLNKDEFLKEYNIDEKFLIDNNIDWNELDKIYNDYSMYRKSYETQANLISNILREHKKVHSVKARVKDENHLIEKIIRKTEDRRRKYGQDFNFTVENYKDEITDLVGIRLSGYRSVHYLIESYPTTEKVITEVQVRTIFEEGYGEIDHQLRYSLNEIPEILEQNLMLLNRIAGSSDEMASLINLLSKNFKDIESEYNKKIEEKNKKILELKENILKNEALDEKDKKLFIKNIESIIN